MQNLAYEIKPDQTLDGRELFIVVAKRQTGDDVFIATYANPHSADALVRLLNNQRDQEA